MTIFFSDVQFSLYPLFLRATPSSRLEHRITTATIKDHDDLLFFLVKVLQVYFPALMALLVTLTRPAISTDNFEAVVPCKTIFRDKDD